MAGTDSENAKITNERMNRLNNVNNKYILANANSDSDLGWVYENPHEAPGRKADRASDRVSLTCNSDQVALDTSLREVAGKFQTWLQFRLGNNSI